MFKKRIIYKITIMKSNNKPESSIENKDFLWLLKTLTPIRNHSLKIPETLLFENGKPLLFLYYTSNNVLRSTSTIKFHEIISLFMRNVYKRKSPIKSSYDNSYSHELDLIRNSYNNEIAVIRLSNRSLKVLENNDLVSILLERNAFPLWSDIISIQSLIKTNCSPGKISNVIYNLREKHRKRRDPEEELIEIICRVLLAKDFRLIYAQFEFFLDDDGKYWLADATEIKIQKLNHEVNSAALIQTHMSAEDRKYFLQSLDYHSSKPKSKNLIQMMNLMNNHYKKIKKELLIDEALSSQFHLEVPDKALAYLPEEKSKDTERNDIFVTSDPRNTKRTLRRLSLFQTSEFRKMRSPRIQGRRLFE